MQIMHLSFVESTGGPLTRSSAISVLEKRLLPSQACLLRSAAGRRSRFPVGRQKTRKSPGRAFS